MARPKTMLVTNADVLKLRSMKEKQKSLKEQLGNLDLEIKNSELDFARAIQQRKLAKDLKFDLKIQTILKRYPAWKEHYISKLGLKAAEMVLKKTKPQEFTHIKITKKAKFTLME